MFPEVGRVQLTARAGVSGRVARQHPRGAEAVEAARREVGPALEHPPDGLGQLLVLRQQENPPEVVTERPFVARGLGLE